MPIRILPESLAPLFFFFFLRRQVRRLLWFARGPGGVERPFLNRLTESDPGSTVYVWARKSPLDEMGLLHFLLNRPVRGNWDLLQHPEALPDFPLELHGVAARLCAPGRMRTALSRALTAGAD